MRATIHQSSSVAVVCTDSTSVAAFSLTARWSKERRGSTSRTKRSEESRHKDPLEGEAGHHGFPQYLGGKYEQELVNLPNDLHYLYHEEVDKILKIPRKYGSAYYKKLSRAEINEILDKLLAHAKNFDERYGTKIEDALKKGIQEANPLAGRK